MIKDFSEAFRSGSSVPGKQEIIGHAAQKQRIEQVIGKGELVWLVQERKADQIIQKVIYDKECQDIDDSVEKFLVHKSDPPQIHYKRDGIAHLKKYCMLFVKKC